MTRSEEHRQQVMAEVASWGLKPRAEYDGKHLIVSWQLADGLKRRFAASSTPSHWRTTLNECARIRRIMRQDQVQRPDPDAQAREPKSFAQHFELPATPPKSDAKRIAELEARVEGLTDLVVEILSKHAKLTKRKYIRRNQGINGHGQEAAASRSRA